MNTPAKMHVFPSPGPETSDALPQAAITVEYVQPLSEAETEAYFADLALSLWLLRQQAPPLVKSA